MDKITLTNAHGTFTTTAMGLDVVIRKYLPVSPNELREIVAERTGWGGMYYDDVHDVSSFLIMLADMDYPA